MSNQICNDMELNLKVILILNHYYYKVKLIATGKSKIHIFKIFNG